ncbi:MAG: 2-C-methyl-D-erythritol 4-phosphate cytidylyltransferase [Candidatus Lokiarchaeota archaeon]|nr:2-C-methyl-D-erythritol 4-phosphate cytidylyltransferase [Candidatus Lokiarchaeota archaeon]
MKIIGPCAGIGSRLRPFTLSKPKAFINVAGKTVLEHILNKFSDTFDSETELILIVGYKKRQISEFVRLKYHDKFQLTFIEQIPRGYNDDIPFYWGLGEAVYLANSRFEESSYSSKEADKREGSLIFLADMIPIDEYSYLMYRYYESDVDGIITVMEVPKEDASSYGVVVVDNNSLIQKLIEKPKEFVSNLAIAGLYAFSNSATKALFNIIKGYLDKRTENSKEVFLTESLQKLIDSGFKIAAVNLKKGILDFGRPSEVLNGNRYLLERESVKKEEFQELKILSEKSFIKNPVYIGKNTSILKSVIGPYVSIGPNSTIESCILENCVVESDTFLKNVISENSIIGSNVRVENISKDNLIIGDKSIY